MVSTSRARAASLGSLVPAAADTRSMFSIPRAAGVAPAGGSAVSPNSPFTSRAMRACYAAPGSRAPELAPARGRVPPLRCFRSRDFLHQLHQARRLLRASAHWIELVRYRQRRARQRVSDRPSTTPPGRRASAWPGLWSWVSRTGGLDRGRGDFRGILTGNNGGCSRLTTGSCLGTRPDIRRCPTHFQSLRPVVGSLHRFLGRAADSEHIVAVLDDILPRRRVIRLDLPALWL